MNSWDFLFKIEDVDENLVQSSMDFLYGDKETDSMRKNKVVKFGTRLSKVAIVAAIMAGVLGVTALAAEFFPSLFKKVQSSEPGQYGFYSGMEDVLDKAVDANGTFSPKVFNLPELDSSQIIIGETYFDDENFLIAYRLDEAAIPAQFGFGPDSENFEKLYKNCFDEEGTDTFEEYLAKGWNPEGQIEQMQSTLNEAGLGFIHHVSTFNSLFGELKDHLTEEEWERACRELKETGHVGVVYRTMFISDHIGLEDGDELRPSKEGKLWDICSTEEGDIIMCDVLDDILPEKYKNQKTLTLNLKVRGTDHYVYMDAENGTMYYVEEAGAVQVPVTMTRAEK